MLLAYAFNQEAETDGNLSLRPVWYAEFQYNQGYTERLCLQKEKNSENINVYQPKILIHSTKNSLYKTYIFHKIMYRLTNEALISSKRFLPFS